MGKPKLWARNGAVLVFVLLVCVVMVILIFSLLTSSQYALRLKIRSEGLSLAEAGVEFARGSLQVDPSTTQASTRDVTGNTQLFYTGGSSVKFPSGIPNGIGGKDAYGIMIADDVGSTRGFFAYEMVGVDPVECYSMGCIGPSSNEMEENKMIILHVSFKPYTYSEYTQFFGNPNQNINISAETNDPFYGTALYASDGGSGAMYSPGEYINAGGTQQSFNKTFSAANLRLKPGEPGKEFIGFKLGSYFSPKITTDPYNPKFYVSPSEINDVRVSDNSGLFGIDGQKMGMPTSSGKDTDFDGFADEPAQVENVMNDLKDISKTSGLGGIYIEGNRTMVGDLVETRTTASYPAISWQNHSYTSDDEMYDHGGTNSNNPYLNKFLSAKEDPTDPQYSLDASGNFITTRGLESSSDEVWDELTYWWKNPDTDDWSDANLRTADPADDYQNREYVVKFDVSGGRGRVTISNINQDYQDGSGGDVWSIMNNGSSEGYSGTKPYWITDTSGNPTIKIIYLRGNARVYGTVKGRLTLAAEGKITVGRDSTSGQADLTYDFLNQNDIREGIKPTDLSGSDILGLVTPRKIEIDPGIDKSVPASQDAVEKFAICATMMNMGSPPPNDSFTTSNGKFTIQAKEKFDPYFDSNTTAFHTTERNIYQKFTLFGSSILFNRNKNYWSYYDFDLDGKMDETKELYDERLLRSQPPYFPTISNGWNIVYWAEVHTGTGEDIKYKRL